MDAFNELRKQARHRRKNLVAKAEQEYQATLERIAALEKDLRGTYVSTHKSMAACVEKVMPSDRPFTMVDLMTGLQLLDPKRVWHKMSVTNHLTKLRRKRIIRRISPARGPNPAVYVREGVQVDEPPFGDMSLKDVLAQVLGERGPSRVAELAVAIVRGGYVTTMARKRLVEEIQAVLRSDERFREDGGKWSVVGA